MQRGVEKSDRNGGLRRGRIDMGSGDERRYGDGERKIEVTIVTTECTRLLFLLPEYT